MIPSALVAAFEQLSHKVRGVAEEGLEAIALIKVVQRECAILDINMPEANGPEVCLEAKRWPPKIRFAILTDNPSGPLFSGFIDAGVPGIFLKSDNPDFICAGINAILRGQTVLLPTVIKALSPDDTHSHLTNRELQVLQSIARCLPNASLAIALGISRKIINTHRTNLMKKLSVHSSATLLIKTVKYDFWPLC